jgi:hypothetical protein
MDTDTDTDFGIFGNSSKYLFENIFKRKADSSTSISPKDFSIE